MIKLKYRDQNEKKKNQNIETKNAFIPYNYKICYLINKYTPMNHKLN